MIDRAEHIAGLDLGHLTPADIDYFFRTLAERVLIRETLAETGGDKSLAAQLLGIAARTIYRRLEAERAKDKPPRDDA